MAEACFFSMSRHSTTGTEQARVHRSKADLLRHAPPHSGRQGEWKAVAHTRVTNTLRSLRHIAPQSRLSPVEKTQAS